MTIISYIEHITNFMVWRIKKKPDLYAFIFGTQLPTRTCMDTGSHVNINSYFENNAIYLSFVNINSYTLRTMQFTYHLSYPDGDYFLFYYWRYVILCGQRMSMNFSAPMDTAKTKLKIRKRFRKWNKNSHKYTRKEQNIKTYLAKLNRVGILLQCLLDLYLFYSIANNGWASEEGLSLFILFVILEFQGPLIDAQRNLFSRCS